MLIGGMKVLIEQLKNDSSFKLLTIAKAAKFLGVGPSQVKELLLDPACPRVLFKSGSVRIPEELLREFVIQRSKNWYK